jgi:hypothetical protein
LFTSIFTSEPSTFEEAFSTIRLALVASRLSFRFGPRKLEWEHL